MTPDQYLDRLCDMLSVPDLAALRGKPFLAVDRAGGWRTVVRVLAEYRAWWAVGAGSAWAVELSARAARCVMFLVCLC
jgi:hypothetical protein